MKRTSVSLLPLIVILVATALAGNHARAADVLRFHYPDSGAPPWLYLTPGDSKPVGIVADILETVARQSGRNVRYEFQPRESSASSLTTAGGADGALFFSATRPAPKGIATTTVLLNMDSVLVTLQGQELGYKRPATLQNRPLCTLTEEIYPPLILLQMNGALIQRRAKTEQAQLMMLRNGDCVAAIINGPMYRWLAARYHWNDLRVERQPLLNEGLVIGFSAREAGMAAQVNRHVGKLRASGELDRIVARHLPGSPRVSRTKVQATTY